MDIIDEYKLERADNFVASVIGFILIACGIFITALIDAHIFLTIPFIIVLLVIRIGGTIWVYNIAKQLNRDKFRWAFFAFLFPPITLITVGFVDYNIEDPELKKIVINYRKKYNSESNSLLDKNPGLNETELSNEKLKIYNKCNSELKTKLIEYFAEQKSKKIKDYGIQEEIDIEKQKQLLKEDLEKNMNNTFDISSQYDKCPACGAIVNIDAYICPECELRLR